MEFLLIFKRTRVERSILQIKNIEFFPDIHVFPKFWKNKIKYSIWWHIDEITN
jgi:hypothetical protein